MVSKQTLQLGQPLKSRRTRGNYTITKVYTLNNNLFIFSSHFISGVCSSKDLKKSSQSWFSCLLLIQKQKLTYGSNDLA